MSLRPKVGPPRGTYQRDHFHGRYICGRCSAEVHDWAKHNADHEERDAEIAQLHAMISAFITGGQDGDQDGPPSRWTAEQVPDDPTLELRDRANAEGNAVAEASFLRGGLRQVREVFRLRPPARMGLGPLSAKEYGQMGEQCRGNRPPGYWRKRRAWMRKPVPSPPQLPETTMPEATEAGSTDNDHYLPSGPGD